jgi:riboflavin biosynthesis pyrimidine reductase
MVAFEDAAGAYAWPAGFWIRANLVASASGQTSGTSGTSADLTNSQDRRLLRLIRRDCDALIVGAASIRAEGWHLPPRAHTHVVSQGSSLPWESCPDVSRVTEWTALPHEALSTLLTRVVDNLASGGARSVLCEGGVATVRALAQGNHLNELCLSVRGSSLADVQRALRTILPNSSVWTLNHHWTSDDGTTIFSIWRCATDPRP